MPLATLDLIVTDKSNHSLDIVNASQLQVFEDGKPQILISVAQKERPVVYAIAIDNSLSFKEVFGSAVDAARLLIDKNKEADETELIRFVSSDRIETVLPFTPERSALLDNLNSSFYLQSGQSSVVDAVYLSARAASEYNAGRNNARWCCPRTVNGETNQEQLAGAFSEGCSFLKGVLGE